MQPECELRFGTARHRTEQRLHPNGMADHHVRTRIAQDFAEPPARGEDLGGASRTGLTQEIHWRVFFQ
jgi:hypothetical protein